MLSVDGLSAVYVPGLRDLVLDCRGARPAAEQAAEEQATKATDVWLELVDRGSYRESWNQASSLAKDRVSEGEWEQTMDATRRLLGPLVSRKARFATYATNAPGLPDGRYVIIRYSRLLREQKVW